jgi:hypothetical protein
MNNLDFSMPAEYLQAYAHTANYYYTEGYRKITVSETNPSKENDEQFNILDDLIIDSNLEAFENSLKELKSFDINYRTRRSEKTLLHEAYSLNEPKIVEFLLKKGANDRIPDAGRFVPLARAPMHYEDSSPSVSKEIISLCSKRCLGSVPDVHVIFDTAVDFILEKKWTCVSDEREYHTKYVPHNDGPILASLGLPSLSYRVDCGDLTKLFIKLVTHFGHQAELIRYRDYKSINREDRKIHNIVGKMALFEGDSSESKNFEWGLHIVAYSSGWYFDPTLMCKYQDRDAILAKSSGAVQ